MSPAPLLTTAALLWALGLLASLLLWAWLVYALLRSRAALLRLPDAAPSPPPAEARWPLVSVVVPCRNEAQAVEPALRTLLEPHDTALEVIAVNDRSTDSTGEVLERLAAAFPALRVVHVSALPPGWLGKNHALHTGAQHARGAWLLFRDADVHHGPDVATAAVALAERHGLGHLVLLPRMLAEEPLERAFLAAFGTWFMAKVRCWDLPQPGTRGYVGAGAFSLVRRDAYDAVGGHTRLALEVVDDVKLGLVLRRSGVPQGLALAEGRVWVRWQPGFRATFRGVLKNLFAGAEWRWSYVGLIVGSLAVLSLLPPVTLLLAPHPALQGLAGVLVGVGALTRAATLQHQFRGHALEGVLYPLADAALAVAALLSAALVTWRGAVVWRETRYPLAALRAGCVREADWPAAGAAGWPAPRQARA